MITRRIKALIHQRRLEREFQEEIEFHLAMRAEEQIGNGMKSEAARELARRELGNVMKLQEDVRTLWTIRWWDNLVQDARYGLRSLRRNPGVAITATLTLALGLGVNVAMFNLADAFLLRALPVPDPDQLVQIGSQPRPGQKAAFAAANSYPAFELIRNRSTTLSGAFAWAPAMANAVYRQQADVANLLMVSGDFHQVLGVRPELGRLLNPEDNRIAGGSPVLVLSHSYWKRRFGADPGVIGQSLNLNAVPMTIIGVTASGFHGVTFPDEPELTMPLAMRDQVLGEPPGKWQKWNDFWVRVIGRMRPGVTQAQVLSELETLYVPIQQAMLDTAPPQWNEIARKDFGAFKPALVPAALGGHSNTRQQARLPLIFLMATAGLLLLLGCANIGSLLWARAITRQRELATRVALGAGVGRLLRQVMVEGALLVAPGLLLAVFAAQHAGVALLALVNEQPERLGLSLEPSLRLAGFAAATGFASVLLFSMVPAWLSTWGAQGTCLRSNTVGAARFRMGKALVSFQVALAALLLTGAALFARTVAELQAVQIGFRPEQVTVFCLEGTQIRYDALRARSLFDELLIRLRAQPGVLVADYGRSTPQDGAASASPIVLAEWESRPVHERIVHHNLVGPRFLEALGATLISGRDVHEHDIAGAPAVAVVNEAFAKRFFPGRSAVGEQFAFFSRRDRQIQIIGVLQDMRENGSRAPVEPTVYLARTQAEPETTVAFALRSSLPPAASAALVRDAVRSLEPSLPVLDLRPLSSRIASGFSLERSVAIVCGGFGVLALLLAATGLYGTISFLVARRAPEAGVRIALGARAEQLVWGNIGDALRSVLLGIAVAAPLIWWGGMAMRSILFGSHPLDLLTIAGALALVLAATLFASWWAARKIAHVDATAALRQE